MRTIQVDDNASVLVIAPSPEGGFNVHVDTPIPDERILDQEDGADEVVCARAAFFASEYVVAGPTDAKEE